MDLPYVSEYLKKKNTKSLSSKLDNPAHTGKFPAVVTEKNIPQILSPVFAVFL